MATLKEIAREAKVSESLVSRFFSEDPTLRVREDKRRCILAAESKLGGYRANRAARSLAKGLAYNLVMPIHRGYSVEWLHANVGRDQKMLEAVLAAKGFRLSMTFFDESEKKALIEELVEARGFCDGLVLQTGVVDDAIAKILRKARFPHVSNDTRDEARGLNVVCDHALAGMRQAVTHLKDLGHRRIGYLGKETDSSNILGLRDAMFRQVMLELDLPCEVGWDCRLPGPGNAWVDPQWCRKVREIIRAYLDCPESQRATAMIASDDRVALELIDVMDRVGLVAGKDLSIVGYGDLEMFLERSDPILTTVSNSQETVGRRSADLLLDQILNNQSQIIQEHILVELIARVSTGPCQKGK